MPVGNSRWSHGTMKAMWELRLGTRQTKRPQYHSMGHRLAGVHGSFHFRLPLVYLWLLLSVSGHQNPGLAL